MFYHFLVTQHIFPQITFRLLTLIATRGFFSETTQNLDKTRRSFWIFAWIIEEVIIRCMLAKMVPSHCQSFTESSRNAVARLSTIVASITAPLSIPFLEWWSTGIILIICLLLFFFIIRRENLCRIKEINFHVDVEEQFDKA